MSDAPPPPGRGAPPSDAAPSDPAPSDPAPSVPAPSGPPTLSDLFVYPLKSAAGIRLGRADLVDTGLRFDRRWMVVDDRGGFLTQREEPRLALVRTSLDADALRLAAPGAGSIALPLGGPGAHGTDAPADAEDAVLWGERVPARRVSAAARAWISGFLGRAADIVRFPDDGRREVDPDYARADDRVAFADGYPLLLVGEASLTDLGDRLVARGEARLPMDRFRPNLVVRGSAPFAEDGWRSVRIGGVTFRVVKPCARCVTTTVDQATAEVGREPLRTLATYRRASGAGAGKVMFGQNLLHDAPGELRVGDRLTVLEPA